MKGPVELFYDGVWGTTSRSKFAPLLDATTGPPAGCAEQANLRLNMEAITVQLYGEIHTLHCGLILWSADDEVIVGMIGGQAGRVGYGDAEGRIACLRAKVAHQNEERFEFSSGGGVGEDDSGLGEVGHAGEGKPGVGEELQVGQHGGVGNATDVERGRGEDGAGEVLRRPGLAVGSGGGPEGEAELEFV